MNLTVQKRLSASVLKCSKKRIALDPARLEDIKEAITKKDIKVLIGEGVITEKQKTGVSRVRARKTLVQKRKGLKKGPGKRKGKANARTSVKTVWMRQIRYQRDFLKELKDKGIITSQVFTVLYKRAKGGFFRSKRHIKIYIEENRLAKSVASEKIPKKASK